MRKILTALTGFVAMCPLAASADLINSSVTACASADATGTEVISSDSQEASTAALNATASASSEDDTASADVSASFSSASSGVVSAEHSWDVDNGGIASFCFEDIFELTFEADADGFFDLSYELLASGVPDTFGLQGYDFRLLSLGGEVLEFLRVGGGLSPSDETGSFSWSVDSGMSYIFRAFTFGNISVPSERSRAAMQSIDFDWSAPIGETVSVPEPSALMLLAAGLIGMSFARRRKKA